MSETESYYQFDSDEEMMNYYIAENKDNIIGEEGVLFNLVIDSAKTTQSGAIAPKFVMIPHDHEVAQRILSFGFDEPFDFSKKDQRYVHVELSIETHFPRLCMHRTYKIVDDELVLWKWKKISLMSTPEE